jgi:MazG C-terminal domain
LTIEFIEQVAPTEQLTAMMTLISAAPNSFVDGPTRQPNGKLQGYALNSPLGDPLTDNTCRADAYRFHDAIHFVFMAVLGWSPNIRALLRLKRRSDPQVGANEDGARAIFAEEGLAAVLSRLATRRSGFQRETTVENEIIEIATAATTDLEPSLLPGWIWRRAVNQGFNAMRELAADGGGYLIADLDRPTLTYRKILSEALTEDAT